MYISHFKHTPARQAHSKFLEGVDLFPKLRIELTLCYTLVANPESAQVSGALQPRAASTVIRTAPFNKGRRGSIYRDTRMYITPPRSLGPRGVPWESVRSKHNLRKYQLTLLVLCRVL